MPRKQHNSEGIDAVGLPSRVSRSLGVAHQTISGAIDRGDIPTLHLGCGAQVVRIEDVRAYLALGERRGRPITVDAD